MDPSSSSTTRLRNQVTVRLLLGLATIMAALFLPAGTFAYWEGWTYLAVLFLPLVFAAYWLLKNSPDLLARRMMLRERAPNQLGIIAAAGVLELAAFVLPGFDHRWGWSDVPAPLVIAADVIVLASYLLVFRVQQVNEYASRIVQVEQGQQIIDSGPYAFVRHPMYLGMLFFLVATPLALGSYWAVIPALGMLPVLMARIRGEEALLRRDLLGYIAYTERVRYRLLPGIW